MDLIDSMNLQFNKVKTTLGSHGHFSNLEVHTNGVLSTKLKFILILCTARLNDDNRN